MSDSVTVNGAPTTFGGTVTAVGDEVTRHRIGDTVAVGCMVDSCMECDQCLEGWEVFCRKGCVQTYNSADSIAEFFRQRGTTDVSEFEVVQEDVRFMLPKEIRKALAAAGA
jgi:uncharacterized zinc-type alcohol dehydrogenase-like protein